MSIADLNSAAYTPKTYSITVNYSKRLSNVMLVLLICLFVSTIVLKIHVCNSNIRFSFYKKEILVYITGMKSHCINQNILKVNILFSFVFGFLVCVGLSSRVSLDNQKHGQSFQTFGLPKIPYDTQSYSKLQVLCSMICHTFIKDKKNGNIY